MSSTGIRLYGSLRATFCEECGRAKSLRLLGYLTGCKTCDESITRHRCVKAPDLDGCPVGTRWACPDCGTVWRVAEHERTCGECGQFVEMERTWEMDVRGDRVDSAPRYEPPPLWQPLRNLFPRRPERVTLPRECVRSEYGFMVHVKPGCRCPR